MTRLEKIPRRRDERLGIATGVIPRLISIYRAIDNDEAARAFGHSLNSAGGLIRSTSSGMTRIHCACDDERELLSRRHNRA